MGNKDIAVALDYHNATKHSVQSISEKKTVLDQANRPLPYKIYSSLTPIPLPIVAVNSASNAEALFDALARPAISPSGEHLPDLHSLAQLCFLSNGVTKKARVAGREFSMRAAASTGALFHIEIYLVCAALPDLAAGIYHYGAQDHALRELRSGDFRHTLAAATASEPAIIAAPVIAIFTSTFWRNAYRYRERAYRHACWDSGTMLANSLAVANALSMPAQVVLGFVDEQVNTLLDIDSKHEATIGLLSFGHTTRSTVEAPAFSPLHLPTVQLSRYEVTYPSIEMIHQNSSLVSTQEVMDWRAQPESVRSRPIHSARSLTSLQPYTSSKLPTESVEVVIRRRSSARHFSHTPITFAHLSTVLSFSLKHIPFDCLHTQTGTLNSVYVIANAVEGLEHGTYVFNAQQQALEQLQTGTFRHAARFLALNQELGGEAAVNIYFLTDLAYVLTHFGNRGYRLAQLEAAIMAGRIYLSAYALSLGASGLTFFDDDVVTFFSPHAPDHAVMFLIALGHTGESSKA